MSRPASKASKRARAQATDVESSSSAPAARSGDAVQEPDAQRARLEGASAAASITAPAAAASSSRPSSHAARLDLDSLSIILSMLNTTDFLSAIRVCKQWRAARMRHTAWPTFDLASFVQSLRDDNYDDPARRRLRLALGGIDDDSQLSVLDGSDGLGSAASAAGGSMWRHVTDARVECTRRHPSLVHSARYSQTSDAALQQLARLPYLSAVNLQSFSASEVVTQQFLSAVSGRLQAALLFDSRTLSSRVHLLRSLRALVIRGSVTGASLIQLQLLEYFHLEPECGSDVQFGIGQALRLLATNHSLVSISLGSSFCSPLDVVDQFLSPRLLGGAESDGHGTMISASAAERIAAVNDLPAVDSTRPCKLQDFSATTPLDLQHMCDLLLLPALTRLQCAARHRYTFLAGSSAGVSLPIIALMSLQQLRLSLTHTVDVSVRNLIDWSHLQQHTCRLRVLQLTGERGQFGQALTRVPITQLQRVLAANCNTLEEFSVNASIRLENDETHAVAAAAAAAAAAESGWSVLSRCSKLRHLEVPLERTSSAALFAALADAPAIQSLSLTGVTPSLITSAALAAMAGSRTWCCLRLFGASLRLQAAHLEARFPAASVDPAAARRMRIVVHRGPELEEKESFVIRPDGSGQSRWQRL